MNLEEFEQIQNRYFQASQEIMKIDISLLIKYLRDINNSYVILRALSSLDFSTIKLNEESLFDEIVYLSIKGNSTQILWSRKIVKNINRDYLFQKLGNSIKTILENGGIECEYDDYYYRNIADLFYELDFKDELKKFLDKYCKNSTDINVREIYDDYI